MLVSNAMDTQHKADDTPPNLSLVLYGMDFRRT